MDRSNVVDFPIQITSGYNSFFYSTLDTSYSITIFTKPFTVLTWMMIYAFVIILSLILFLTVNSLHEVNNQEFSLSKCFIFVYGAYGGVASKRWNTTPDKLSSRMIFIITLLCGCLIHWHWKASIISHLSVVTRNKPFRTLEDLKSSPYQITTIGDSVYELVWRQANSSISKQLWNTKFKDKDKSLKKTEEEAIAQTISSQYALYLYLDTLKDLKEYKNCLLEESNIKIDKENIAFALPKNSPFLFLFNDALMKMRENGEIERIFAKYKKEARNCFDRNKKQTLGFENIIFAFIILFHGFGTSLLISFLEQITSKFSLCLQKRRVRKLLSQNLSTKPDPE